MKSAYKTNNYRPGATSPAGPVLAGPSFEMVNSEIITIFSKLTTLTD